MNPHTFLRFGLSSMISGVVIIPSAQAQTGKTQPKTGTPQRPNIIYIMSDDHAANAVSCYGGRFKEVAPTPNIDRIAREGARLDHCYATNSISTPSRAAILTGQYSHCNGVYTLSDALDTAKTHVAHLLQQAGYHTAIIGKWHLKTEPKGFDYYSVFHDQGFYHNPSFIEKGTVGNKPFSEAPRVTHTGAYCTNVVAEKTMQWIDQQKDSDQPFFIMCHFKAPHRNWQPTDSLRAKFNGVIFPEPENLYDDYQTRGTYAQKLNMGLEIMGESDLKTKLPEGLSRDEYRKQAYQIYMRDYLACVAGVDQNVGRILDYLDKNGLTENTIIIYTSDQGFFMGEHGWFDKRLMQEESIKMPFVVRYPKEIKAGIVNEDITINVDFAPTFLDYAGVKAPQQMQGHSMRANLKGKTPKNWPTGVYYRYWMHNDFWHHAVANLGIRTKDYKLIFYYGLPLEMTGAKEPAYTPEWELYDLRKDPAEMNNVYNDPAYTKVVKALKKQLLEQKRALGDDDSKRPQMQQLLEQEFAPLKP